MDVGGIVVATLAGVWTVLTIVCQFQGPVANAIRSWDPLGLIPTWTFFAPNPGTADHYLVYQVVDQDGTVGAWEQIETFRGRRWFHAIWNPERRRSKAIADCISAIMTVARKANARREALVRVVAPSVQLSIPYLVLLNLAVDAAQAGAAPGSMLRFAIVERESTPTGADSLRPIFVSGRHALVPSIPVDVSP